MKKNRNLFPVVSAITLAGLFILTIGIIYRYNPQFNDELIVKDLKTLKSIFNRINQTAGIIGFEHERDYIDFLNVKDFVGSEIGSMNLKYPSKWQGPYLKDNLTAQEKLYEIIKIKNNYYIIPGEGVKLANNKIIGHDIIIDKNSDIENMINDKSQLLSDSGPLAIKLDLFYAPKNGIIQPLLKSDDSDAL